jgi:signal transduction histidine kinase
MLTPTLIKILDSLPNLTLVLDDQNEIIFSNRVPLLKKGDELSANFLKVRLGNFISCIHVNRYTGMCESNACNFCGIPSIIETTKKNKEKTVGEARLILRKEDMEFPVEVKVIANLFESEGITYTLLSLVNISDEKRKDIIDRIFYHDLINLTGSLNNIIHYIHDEHQETPNQEMWNLAKSLIEEINDEILAQQQILAAERGDLFIELNDVKIYTILSDVVNKIGKHNIATNKIIEVFQEIPEDLIIKTDSVLLKRVLINIIKNALEAISENEKIEIKTILYDDYISFQVNNKGVMTEDVQRNIFMRTYTTKGKGRGLGTYSMKLIGENYLKGNISYISNEIEGTTFIFNLKR